MSDNHIFRASGDSCPICLTLDGQKVAAGYTAHDGCQCQTVPADDQLDCEWSFESMGTTRDGHGVYDAFLGYQVTVKCPDGSEVGGSGQFDGHPHTAPHTDFDVFLELVYDEVEAMAQQICDSCAPAKDKEFRCC